jgi:hypothetical protein
MIAQAGATWAAAVAAQQIGGDAAFIEKDVLAPIAKRLAVAPPLARQDDVRPTLFVGVYRFF